MPIENNDHFQRIKDSRDDINWILEQQAQLRAELMAFYKKDLKEIQASLSGISSDKEASGFAKDVMDDVKKHFIDQWLRSYNLITPAGTGTFETQIKGQ